ncbi:hypothetical protein AAA799E16_01378 [Marine Group I thaumarchaeote SCGC AAA799-E16]|uniref:Uncharacterized protein n=6 Tax=Marine Group I TaxID=905826 RepID=A0A087S7E1_9ARCH|nr:hypothetical protein AAA799N04_00269 [Marine Group I thaumarchaeote SCGC AAA799-N04]KER05933.1 hypothetical protein AAA799E16_01378 [Marine Group I thaumarchaeote SCGC AAA799-E16]KFM16036.1 hypothetical protein AAA799D11_00825 [Marine Group I thaumarchaeote SCGC AAA799-D11]KFM17773.1 hypothetical protein SCCGRSA3_01703 [Marine Group I thaumarchaeote SCGC RSA3]KFM19495.1 hypothetical protein AAA799P11_00686 [Marine Group I thaumarchaeote SCGC AAA799-P11]KFM21645.1 hypothetical protein AAA799
MLRIAVILIISVIALGSFSTQSIFAHQPDFPVQTPEDILKFCEFFYEEYELFGLDGLVDLHPQYPNLRACAILYNHIAWSSTHQARDIVLIAEIEKYLGDSSFLKERHIKKFTTMPAWVIQDTERWTDGQYKDSLYAYGIRALIENNIISPKIVDNVSQRLCIDGLCAKETDYVTYSHTSKYGNTITEKFEVEKIDDDGIMINSKIVSEEGIKNHRFLLDEDSRIPVDDKCCKTEKFLYKTPIKIGDVIDEKYQVYGTVTYPIGNLLREGMVAENQDKTKVIVIDKQTGLLLNEKFEKTEITTNWEKTSVLQTNVFEESEGIQYHDLKIPAWWKTSAMWFTEGLTSEDEYVQALEYMIEKRILIV